MWLIILFNVISTGIKVVFVGKKSKEVRHSLANFILLKIIIILKAMALIHLTYFWLVINIIVRLLNQNLKFLSYWHRLLFPLHMNIISLKFFSLNRPVSVWETTERKYYQIEIQLALFVHNYTAQPRTFYWLELPKCFETMTAGTSRLFCALIAIQCSRNFRVRHP